VKMQGGGTDFGDRLFPSSINVDDQNGSPGLFTKNEVNSIHAYRTGSNTGSADPLPWALN